MLHCSPHAYNLSEQMFWLSISPVATSLVMLVHRIQTSMLTQETLLGMRLQNRQRLGHLDLVSNTRAMCNARFHKKKGRTKTGRNASHRETRLRDTQLDGSQTAPRGSVLLLPGVRLLLKMSSSIRQSTRSPGALSIVEFNQLHLFYT